MSIREWEEMSAKEIRSLIKPTCAQMTWDEIRDIEETWKGDPAEADIRRLVRHLRFIEHLQQRKHKAEPLVSNVVAAAWTFFIEREKGETCDCLTEYYNNLHDALGALERFKNGVTDESV